MTKSQLKERSLITTSFAFIKLGFDLLDIDPMKVDISKFNDTYDIKLILLYRKLYKLNKMFTNKKILNFFNKRIKHLEDNIDKTCQPLYIGLILLYLYKNIDTKKEIVISELNDKDIKYIIEDYKNISKCTIDKAIDIFKAIYPDKEGYIKYLEVSKRFPYNLERSNNEN